MNDNFPEVERVIRLLFNGSELASLRDLTSESSEMVAVDFWFDEAPSVFQTYTKRSPSALEKNRVEGLSKVDHRSVLIEDA